MKTWLIEPRDPLIFRDGRPFHANPGARAKTLAFPFPSTLIGAARTLAGRDHNGHFDRNKIDYLLQKEIRGPLLIAISKKGRIEEWIVPAPADALVLKQKPYDKKAGRLVMLTVLQTPVGAETDLADLALVGPVGARKGKPHSKAPAFWRWQKFEDWLSEPKVQNDVLFSEIGVAGPERESRMHVSIKKTSQTAENGALFQTSGLEFMAVEKDEEGGKPPRLDTAMRLALAVRTDAAVTAGLGFLGGERRAVQWSPIDDSFPVCPNKIRKRIKQDKHCRLILLTPGLFEQGYLPSLNPQITGGVKATIVAAAVNRYQTVSGWDYDKQLPKPTQCLAPAGSVYFLKLDGDETAINQFIDAMWMHNISDDEQDRRDGFGLAVLGIWDGKPKEMEVNDVKS